MTESTPDPSPPVPTPISPSPATDRDPFGSSDSFGLAWSVVPTPFGDVLRAVALSGSEGFRPAPTDVLDTPAAYRIRAELPGIAKESLEIVVRGTAVELRAVAVRAPLDAPEEYLHRERSTLGLYRAIELPEPVLASKAKASLELGILTLELPKQHPVVEPAEVRVPIA